MAKYVPDIKTQRWVVIAAARVGRPVSSTSAQACVAPPKQACPFCPGNELNTPPEVFRIGSGDKDKEGWQVRVVPNKFPITDTHEVIIHSPDHEKGIHELPIDQAARIMNAFLERYRAHDPAGHVLIFCNHGFHAGASLKHPHSQLVVVPRQINLDALSLEPVANIVTETSQFTTYCPDFSQWPYEVWIAPKEKGKKFGNIQDNEILPLSQTLVTTLQKIEKALTDPSTPFKQANEPFVYNYYIYHGVNWFIRIIPRAVHRAGFELGTGLSVNVVDPTDAAERLRNIV